MITIDSKVLHVIPQGDDQEIRVIRKEYKGKQYIDIRKWFLVDGVPMPTKKGLTITENEYQQIKEAV